MDVREAAMIRSEVLTRNHIKE